MVRGLLHILGLDSGNGLPYLWWSGIGADLPMFLGVGVFARRHNCHQRGCWRLGRRRIAGTTYVVCSKHHPDC